MTEKPPKSGPFPQVVNVRGINVMVHNWDELEEIVRRFGVEPGADARKCAANIPVEHKPASTAKETR